MVENSSSFYFIFRLFLNLKFSEINSDINRLKESKNTGRNTKVALFILFSILYLNLNLSKFKIAIATK